MKCVVHSRHENHDFAPVVDVSATYILHCGFFVSLFACLVSLSPLPPHFTRLESFNLQPRVQHPTQSHVLLPVVLSLLRVSCVSRLAEEKMKAVTLQPESSTLSDEVTQEEWDA